MTILTIGCGPRRSEGERAPTTEPASAAKLSVQGSSSASAAAGPDVREAPPKAKPQPWTPPDEPVMEGIDGAGQLLAAGQYEDALARVDELEVEEGSSAWFRAQAIRGRALRELERHKEAVLALLPLVQSKKLKNHLPAELIGYELARARIGWAETLREDAADAQLQQAAAELKALTHVRPNRMLAPMRVERALALAKVKDSTRAEGRYAAATGAQALERIIRDYPNHVDVGRWRVDRANLLVTAGRAKEAALAFRLVTIDRAGEDEAKDAWQALEALAAADARVPLVPLTRSEKLTAAANARTLRLEDASLEILDGLLAENLPAYLEREARWSRARTRYKAHDWDGCAEDMAVLRDLSNSLEYRKQHARCLDYGSRSDEASQLWLDGADSPRRGLAAEALWNAVDYSVRAGDYGKAQALLREYEEERKYTGHSAERRWLRAWLPYRLGDDAAAIPAFQHVERLGGERRTAARYFRGKVMLRSADRSVQRDGEALLREVVADGDASLTSRGVRGGFPGYYGLMARARLTEAGLDVPTAPTLEPMRDADRWRGFADTRETYARLLPEFAGASPALVRASQLHGVGYVKEAQREYRVAASEFVNGRARINGSTVRVPRSESLVAGLSWKAEWEYPKPLPNADGRRVLRVKDTSDRYRDGLRELAFGMGEPHFVAKLSDANEYGYRSRYYLRAYRGAVEGVASERDVDPLHIWSLMYTESRFRRHVVSYVGARGAMQIWPPSWRRAQKRAGTYDGRLDVDDLFDAEVSLRSSFTITTEVVEGFHGQWPMVYGSYNGGRHNVGRWLSSVSKAEGRASLDDFVEEIVFDETRKYVRRVIGVHAGYHLMYRGELPELPHELKLGYDGDIAVGF